MSSTNDTSTTSTTASAEPTPTSPTAASSTGASSSMANNVSSSVTAVPTTGSSSTTLPDTTTSSTVRSSSTSSSTSSTAVSSSSSSSPTTTSTTAATTSSTAISTTSSVITTTQASSTLTTTNSNGVSSTTTITQTTTETPTVASTTSTIPSTTTSIGTGLNTGSASPAAGGLSQGGVIAVAVVVPIVGVALLALAGIYFWRRRKQRKDAEELRRKEVEDYGYNPNNDPTLPAIAGIAGTQAGDGPFEMREEGSAGYRGWGTTVAGSSTGRKASTTMSGGALGTAYSDGTSPTPGAVSDTRSGDPLVAQSGRPVSDESEALGALGPAVASNTRGGEIHRGPSDASSSYSAANRSDGSGEQNFTSGAHGQAHYYAGDANYGGAYSDGPYNGAPGGRAEMGGQPIIRDNLARRATRIENPSHFPTQASAGISQNF